MLRRPILLPAAFLVALATSTAAPAAVLDDALHALKDTSPIKRYEAIEAIGAMRTPEAIGTLINLTADEDNSWLAVRQLVLMKDASVPFLLQALSDTDIKIVKAAIYALGDLKCREAVEPILSYLSHPSPEIRQNAVFALGYIKDPRAIEPLIQKLRDPDNVVREYAAAALEYFGDHRAVPHLREALRIEQGSIFNMATALYNMGSEDVIDILVEKLKDPAGSNRLYAVYALGKIRDAREIEPLIECLPDENVQWLAVKALINLGGMAVPNLLKAMGRRESQIRLYAIYALGEIGDQRASKPLMDNLISPDFLVRDYSADALIKLKDREVVPRLLYWLEKGDCTIQSQVLKVLGAIGDSSAAPNVRKLLTCDYAQVRMNAAFALGELKDADSIDGLVGLLADENAGVSQMTVNALVKIGPPAADALLAALPGRTGRTETGILQALGKIKSRRAVEELIKKLSSEDDLVRRAATVALTEIGDPKAEEHMVMMLTDRDPHVRMYATVGLMQFGGRLSIRLLLNALRSEETRWLAVKILDKIGPRGVDELIAALKDKNLQWYASQTLTKLDGAVLPQLQEGLKSDDEVIRNNIAMILGDVKDKRAVAALLEAMKDDSRSVALAASSLVSIGDPSAVEPLIQCLTHPNEQVRLYAAYALGHLRDERAIDPLIACLKERDAGIRGIAAYSLGLLRSKKAVIPLTSVISDGDENVRMSAIYALGKIGDMRVTPFIKERYQKDPSERVRAAALETLDIMAYGKQP